MNNFFISLFFLVILLVFEFFNDVIVKQWTDGGRSNLMLMVAFGVHVVVFTLWILAMKYESFSKVVSVYSVLSIAGGIFLGGLLFKEHFSIVNWVGVFIGVISIVMMGVK